MSNQVNIDRKQVDIYFDDTTNNIRKAEVNGLYEILTELVNKTKSNLIERIPSARSPIRPLTVRGSHYATKGDSLFDAIRRSIHKKGEDILEGTVHILGEKQKSSGTFITRFFETGTKIRKQKNGRITGMIRPINFFQNATKNVNGQINEILLRSVEDAINKINSKNG